MNSSQIIGICMTLALGVINLVGAWRIIRKKEPDGFMGWKAEATGASLLGLQCLYMVYLLYIKPEYATLFTEDIVLVMLFLLPAIAVIVVGIIVRSSRKMIDGK